MTGDGVVIVALVDGVARADEVHLPSREIAEDESPYKLVAACGMIGVVYAKAGPFAKAAVCDRCERMVSGCGRYASLDRYNEGCRCHDCRDAMATYRRLLYRRNARGAGRDCPSCGGLKSPTAKACMRCYLETRATCGTNSMYARGCRCQHCSEAHRVYMRAWHQKRRDATTGLEEAA